MMEAHLIYNLCYPTTYALRTVGGLQKTTTTNVQHNRKLDPPDLPNHSFRAGGVSIFTHSTDLPKAARAEVKVLF